MKNKGYPMYKMRNTLMNYYNIVASVCVKVINAIPFLTPMKVIMDWSFVKTSLNLF